MGNTKSRNGVSTFSPVSTFWSTLMGKIGPTVDLYSTGYTNRHASIKELWIEGVTPLLLEAFAIHLWVPPIANSLISTRPMIAGSHALTLAVIGSVVAIFTFLVNLWIHPHTHSILAKTGVGESPLFRSVWVFICACAVSRYTGNDGIMQFTVVTILPLVYVRVPEQLASCAAVYAGIFSILCICHHIALFVAGRPFWTEAPVDTTHHHGYSIASHSAVFVATSVYHILWFSSHRHTSDPTQQPSLSYFFFPWETSALPLSVFRTILVLLSMFEHVGHATQTDGITYTNQKVVEFLRILFLFTTISTFTAWTHCQHKHHNRL